jgi:hypothetical protein
MSYMGQALAFLGHILATAKNMFKAMYVMPTQFTKLFGFLLHAQKHKRKKHWRASVPYAIPTH